MTEVIATSDPEVAFKGADVAVLLGGFPRLQVRHSPDLVLCFALTTTVRDVKFQLSSCKYAEGFLHAQVFWRFFAVAFSDIDPWAYGHGSESRKPPPRDLKMCGGAKLATSHMTWGAVEFPVGVVLWSSIYNGTVANIC